MNFYNEISINDFALLKEIQKDTSIPAKRLLAGIAVIAATILTGILPGLLIMAIVKLATGKDVRNLFEAREIGNEFADNIKTTLKADNLKNHGFFLDKQENPKKEDSVANELNQPK